MKKLLSILAVSGIVATSAPTAVACEESTTDSLKTLDMTKIAFNVGDNLYGVVRTTIADQSGGKLTVDDIKNDATTIQETIFNEAGDLLTDTDTAAVGNYDVKINITAENTVFNPLDWAVQNVTVSEAVVKTTFDTDTFENVLNSSFTATADAYDIVRAEIAAQTTVPNKLTKAEIKSSDTILLAIWKDGTEPISDPFTIVTGTYDIKINITSEDTVFNALDWYTVPTITIA